jgi:hypothetical protein
MEPSPEVMHNRTCLSKPEDLYKTEPSSTDDLRISRRTTNQPTIA